MSLTKTLLVTLLATCSALAAGCDDKPGLDPQDQRQIIKGEEERGYQLRGDARTFPPGTSAPAAPKPAAKPAGDGHGHGAH